MTQRIYLISVFTLTACCLMQGAQDLSVNPPCKVIWTQPPQLQQPHDQQPGPHQPKPQQAVVGVPIQPGVLPPSPPKKRALCEVTERKPLPDLQQQVYFGAQIEPAIKDLMLQEEGRICAAYYMATLESLMLWWGARKYIQEFEKAKRANDIHGILRADQYKRSHTDDLLIVDSHSVDNEENRSRLAALADSGVQILVRTKDRQPKNGMQKMHYKFMIFFHKDRPSEGKFVITGSFNLTNQASNFNWEDIVILKDPAIVSQYVAQHQDLLQYCEPLTEVLKKQSMQK